MLLHYINRLLRQHFGSLTLLLLTLVMFGNVLFGGGNLVLGNHSGDMYQQFIPWRAYGFSQLASGHIALWNPHIYSGAPYMGGFQSALMYPPNAIFLLMPNIQAINWSIALHVFLVGLGMNLWALSRGLHPVAACLSGALLMFGGSFYLHIYAGHLSNLCSMTWTPFIFMALEGVLLEAQEAGNFRRMGGNALFLAMAVALQILAGHPQYVYCTAVGAGIYTVSWVIMKPQNWRAMIWIALAYGAGLLLAAVQILPSYQALKETVRSHALPPEFASVFSFPPENLITLFASDFFGGMGLKQYTGRWYLWEMSIYLGVGATLLAILGFASNSRVRNTQGESAERTNSNRIPMLVSMLVIACIAFGAYTPMYEWLYRFLPGFDRFRGVSKFMYIFSALSAMAAAMGMDNIMRNGNRHLVMERCMLFISLLSLVATYVLSKLDWLQIMLWMAGTHQSYLLESMASNHATLEQYQFAADLAKSAAMKSMGVVGLIALLFSGLLAATRRRHALAPLIALLAMAEVIHFAAANRDSFDGEDRLALQVSEFLKQHPGDYRIANAMNEDSAMQTGGYEISGVDPGIVDRYAEFMAYAQGNSPDHATQFVEYSKPSKLHALLGLRYVFSPASDKQVGIREQAVGLPYASLVGSYREVHHRDAVLNTLGKPDFDLLNEVVLERAPNPLPTMSADGQVKVVSRLADEVTLETSSSSSSILLLSEIYTPSWRAQLMDGSDPKELEVMAADYILRAVALPAGKHKVRFYYDRTYLQVGMMLSGAALLGWLLCAFWVWNRVSRNPRLLAEGKQHSCP